MHIVSYGLGMLYLSLSYKTHLLFFFSFHIQVPSWDLIPLLLVTGRASLVSPHDQGHFENSKFGLLYSLE